MAARTKATRKYAALCHRCERRRKRCCHSRHLRGHVGDTVMPHPSYLTPRRYDLSLNSGSIHRDMATWVANGNLHVSHSRPDKKNYQASRPVGKSHLVGKYVDHQLSKTPPNSPYSANFDEWCAPGGTTAPTKAPTGWHTQAHGQPRKISAIPRLPLSSLLENNALSDSQRSPLRAPPHRRAPRAWAETSTDP